MKKLIYKGRTSLGMTQGAEYTEVPRGEDGKVWVYDDFDEPRRMSADLFDQVREPFTLDKALYPFIVVCLVVIFILAIILIIL